MNNNQNFISAFKFWCLCLALCVTPAACAAATTIPIIMDGAAADTASLTVSYDATVGEALGAPPTKVLFADWELYVAETQDFRYEREHGQRTVQAKIFVFEPGDRVSDVLSAISSAGFQPASVRELIAFGQQFPQALQGFGLVALGGRITNNQSWAQVPYLFVIAGTPFIQMCPIGVGPRGALNERQYHFLAVRPLN